MQRKTTLVLVLSGLIQLTWPQEAPPPQASEVPKQSESLQLQPNEPQTVITATSERREGLIHLDVAARDEQGRPLEHLNESDLSLLQDGTAMAIRSFQQANSSNEEERLSEVCLVLDEVDLSPVQFAIARDGVIRFLRSNGGRLAQPVSFLWIKADGVYRSQFPTTIGEILAHDIAAGRAFPTDWMFHPEPKLGVALTTSATRQPVIMSGPVGRSGPSATAATPLNTTRDALWDQVLRTVYGLAVKWRDKPGRKAVIWTGYGWSILGELKAQGGPFPVLVELATRMREARMAMYEITPWTDDELYDTHGFLNVDYRKYLSGVRSPFDPGLKSPVPYFALPVLVIRSGGLVLDKSKDFGGDIAKCVADASDFYTVSFDPPRAAQVDEYHDLTVVSGDSQLRLRAIQGYYNEPVLYDEPRAPERRLGVAELQQFLDSDRGKHERESSIDALELTERLSTSQLEKLRDRLRGKKSKAALTALGDEGVFLTPPKADTPDEPAPDDQMQGQIIARAEKYLDVVVPTLPDFSADAATVKFEQPSAGGKLTWKTAPPNRNLMQTVSEQSNLLYRNGREQQILEKVSGKRVIGRNDLNYAGIFGPILKFILDDVRHGHSKLVWTRWEQSSKGTLAVFRYSVRAENPRYGVVYCCLVDGSKFETLPEHHGELAIDPDTGAVLRITVESEPGWIRETDLSPLRPVLFSNMMVEYGPVNIGTRTFICPLRSVVITRERTVIPIGFWGMFFSVYGPYQILMNDTTYRNYHKFGSEMKILPGFVPVSGLTN